MSSYLFKLERAREHLKVLRDKEREFFNRDPAPAQLEGSYNEDHSIYSFRLRLIEPPYASYSLIIGDYLTNLMASLDHLVYELSSVKSEKPGFPICLNEQQWDSEVGGEKLKGLKKPVVGAIHEWQPFAKWGNPESSPLWMLKTLANWDKHRSLHLMVGHPTGITYSPSIVGNLMALMVEPKPLGPFKDGDVTASFRIPEEFCDKPKPIVATLKAGLLFDEDVPSPTGERFFVVMLLERILEHVEDRVLRALGRFLP